MSYTVLDNSEDEITEINHDNSKHERRGWVSLCAAACMGFVFGFAIEKGNVYLPEVIVKQMLMEDFTMLIMFLSAGATSVFFQCILSLFRHTRELVEIARANNTERHSIILTVIGGGILGSGMAVCGACPGTIVVQMGTGIGYSFLAFVGCLIGTTLVSFILPHVDFAKHSISVEKSTVDRTLGVPMYWIGFPMVLLLAGVVVVFSIFFPYDGYHQSGWLLTYDTWPPYASGILVGSLQLPGILLVKNTIGSSSSYVVYISSIFHWVAPSLAERNGYLAGKYKLNVKNFWQPTYLLTAFIGGLVSAALSNSLYWTDPADKVGMGPALSIIGGLMIVAGSRIAGGCTSGHGLSGFSQLVWVSFLAVASMFAFGIATAFIIQAAHGYPSFI